MRLTAHFFQMLPTLFRTQLTILLFGALFTIQAHSHGDTDDRVSIEPETQGLYNAGQIHFQFQLFDEQSHKAITDKDLTETHTKLVHVIAYDASRNVFNHVHPQFSNDRWTTDLNLENNGSYFVWAQGQLHDGTDFSSLLRIQITNGKNEIPSTPLQDIRSAIDGNSKIELDNTKIRAGKMAMLNYKITRTDGSAPLITPYLGAMAHIIAVSPDGDDLIHVHPMSGNTDNTGMIHATFPTAGDYRVWIQFNDHDELKTMALSIRVTK